jgi:hypothetical protein
MSKNIMFRTVIAAASSLLLVLQGCSTSPTSLPAEKAFALSASALSGVEAYRIKGEVFVIDPGGWVSNKATFEGKVMGHGNLKMQWQTSDRQATSVKSQEMAAYKPLQLLEAIQGNSAVITYAQTPIPSKSVHFQIRLDDLVAKKRVAKGLRQDFALLRSEKGYLQGDPVKAEEILSKAEERLEAALSSLKVTTVCDWTANPRDWFPHQLKEQTVLTYTWNEQILQEKRVSETNFLKHAADGTMIKEQRIRTKGE